VKKKNLTYKILLLLIAALAIFLAFPQNHYIIKAVRHLTPNIDDDYIFATRTVGSSPVPILWEESKEYNSYQLTDEDNQTHKQYQSVSMLVVKNSSILFEQYWDGYNKQKPTYFQQPKVLSAF